MYIKVIAKITFLILLATSCSNISRGPAVYLNKDGVLNPDPKYITSDIGKYKKEIQDSIKTILKKCPPEKCYILAPGRSLAIIIEYLDSIHKDYVGNFPLSAFAFDINSTEIYDEVIHSEFERSVHPSFLPALSASDEEKLFLHFDKFIDVDIIKGREIYLVDFALSGNTLFSLNQYLSKYFEINNINYKINLMGFSTKYGSEIIQKNSAYFKKDIDLILADVNNKDTKFIQSTLRNHEQKPYSRYGRFSILKDNTYSKRSHEWSPVPYMKQLDMYGKQSLANAKLLPIVKISSKDFLSSCSSLLKQLLTSPVIRARQGFRKIGW